MLTQLQILIETDIKQQLKDLAAAEGRSVGAVVREMIQNGLQGQEGSDAAGQGIAAPRSG